MTTINLTKAHRVWRDIRLINPLTPVFGGPRGSKGFTSFGEKDVVFAFDVAIVITKPYPSVEWNADSGFVGVDSKIWVYTLQVFYDDALHIYDFYAVRPRIDNHRWLMLGTTGYEWQGSYGGATSYHGDLGAKLLPLSVVRQLHGHINRTRLRNPNE